MTSLAVQRAAASLSAIAELEFTPAALVLRWQDGRQSRFPTIWLYDNRPEGRAAGTLGLPGQRLFDIAALPEEMGPEGMSLSDAKLDAAGDLALVFAPDGARSLFSTAWLRAHALDPASRAERQWSPKLWDASFAAHLPRAAYPDLAADGQALARWLRLFRDHGLALLHDVPVQSGMLCKVVELFGYVRETNYGRFFDVISIEKPDNLAYTGLALGNHTDNPYRDPVPQLQLLHCLAAASDGGESIAVDGFAAAERLRREAPEDFQRLIRQKVPFRYADAGADLTTAAPLIETDAEGRIEAVRYNNRSAAPFDMAEEQIEDFYRAYRRFGRLLHDPAFAVGFKLGPGDLFMVDNRRVLHGRRGFGSGRRHLQGCYADKDSLLSKLRVLERGPGFDS